MEITQGKKRQGPKTLIKMSGPFKTVQYRNSQDHITTFLLHIHEHTLKFALHCIVGSLLLWATQLSFKTIVQQNEGVCHCRALMRQTKA